MGKSVEIQFEGDGGKVRRLRYDFNAISELEEKLDAPIGALLSDQKAGFRSLRGLLWAGLKWENRALTPEKVGELIQKHLDQGGTIALFMEKANEALKLSGLFGADKPEGEGSDPTEEAGTTQTPTSSSTTG